MAAGQLTCEEIRLYLVLNGGKVSNRDATRHFKRYLTDPVTKESVRSLFKYYINKLATIRSENNEKCLILRPEYFNPNTLLPPPPSHMSPPPVVLSAFTSNMPQYQQLPDPMNSIGIPLATSAQGSHYREPKSSPQGSAYGYSSPSGQSPIRAPPPYRAPPPFTPSPGRASPGGMSLSSNLSLQDSVVGQESASQISIYETPKVPPRRRSADKMSLHSIPSTPIDIPKENKKPSEKEDQIDKETVSVKERTQKFNRLASVDDELNSPSPKKVPQKSNEKGAEDHDDGVSVTSLEPKKCREWYVTAAKADYIALSKLALEEPLLVKVKTVLHWAAKHGNSDIIKLFAGTYRANVNARTNGGYTPLHLAAQYGHDDVFELLIKVYKADFNIADFSGRTPEKYRLLTESDQNPKTTQKFKGRKKQSDKDRFLRIGSLNVRVKKTTEAFSNFLGVGGSATISHIDTISEKVHKGWGSADNVLKNNLMPAPKSSSTKRKYKRVDSTPIRTSSNPSTPQQPPRSRLLQRHSLQDSDSDTAAGFDSQWQYY